MKIRRFRSVSLARRHIYRLLRENAVETKKTVFLANYKIKNNMKEKEIIIGVKVETNTEAAIKKIIELNEQIEKEKQLQKEYNKEMKEGKISREDYNREMELSKTRVTQYSDKVRALRKEVQNNIKTEKEMQGSLTQLRAALSNLTAQYDKLSQAEREGAKGQELQTKIKAITEQLKGAEEETGRFYRNVGNYEEAIKSAIVPTNGLSSSLFQLAEGGDSAGVKIKAFSKAVLSLAKNPYFLAVAGVAGTGTGTSDSVPAMLSNGESVMTAKATAMFGPMLSAMNVAGGGVPINAPSVGSDMLAKAFEKALNSGGLSKSIADAVKNVHPVVAVTEINKVQAQVKVVENLGDV